MLRASLSVQLYDASLLLVGRKCRNRRIHESNRATITDRACTGENIIGKQENSAPSIIIQSHSDGVELQGGVLEEFRAQVSDDDNDFLELEIAWYIDNDQICDWVTATTTGS
mgnify:CR=1 FL=1|tara:strand:- start:206 stop:541 length:336 start_codon:yes stop_codon:yes gene_type:complete